MLNRMRLIVMLTFQGLPDKYRCQHRKDEGLQEGHQYFDQVYKYSKPY